MGEIFPSLILLVVDAQKHSCFWYLEIKNFWTQNSKNSEYLENLWVFIDVVVVVEIFESDYFVLFINGESEHERPEVNSFQTALLSFEVFVMVRVLENFLYFILNCTKKNNIFFWELIKLLVNLLLLFGTPWVNKNAVLHITSRIFSGNLP